MKRDIQLPVQATDGFCFDTSEVREDVESVGNELAEQLAREMKLFSFPTEILSGQGATTVVVATLDEITVDVSCAEAIPSDGTAIYSDPNNDEHWTDFRISLLSVAEQDGERFAVYQLERWEL